MDMSESISSMFTGGFRDKWKQIKQVQDEQQLGSWPQQTNLTREGGGRPFILSINKVSERSVLLVLTCIFKIDGHERIELKHVHRRSSR